MPPFLPLVMHAAEGVIIEEFIQGEEFSLDTFSLNGKILGQTINHYYPTPLEAMSNPWIQWRVILRKEHNGKAFDDIRKAGKKALDILGYENRTQSYGMVQAQRWKYCYL